MPVLTYDGQQYICRNDQSVLDVFTAHGVPVPSSCRSGVCQTCMMRALAGTLPAAAQVGLKDTLKAQNYFLACACKPQADLTVTLPDERAQPRLAATVCAVRPLNGEIVCLELKPEEKIDYKAGQFINLFKDATGARSYSLASLPSDAYLQLHVRRLPQGRISGWIHEELKPGDRVRISAPTGHCFYTSNKPEQPLLLIGSGSGLAPLYGILRDALSQGHRGPIHLYHGSRTVAGLYLEEELRALTRRYAQVSYTPCISGTSAPKDYANGRANEVALREQPKLNGWRVFLCGHPDMVKLGKKKVFLAGAAMKDIYADAFLVASPHEDATRQLSA